MGRHLLTYAIFLASFHLAAQDKGYHFEYFSIENGLCHNRLTCLLQDRLGFLWIGTENGLMRYDGIRFHCYLPVPGDSTSISSASIVGMEEDNLGHIWIRTLNGINQYDPVSGKFRRWLNYPNHFTRRKEAEIPNSFPTPTGEILYFSPQGNLVSFDTTTKKSHEVDLNAITNSKALHGGNFLRATDSTVWLGMSQGLVHFNFYTDVGRLYPHRQENKQTTILTGDPTRPFFNLWGQGLFQLNPGNGNLEKWIIGDGSDLPNVLHSISHIDSTHLWLATEAGLFELNISTGESTAIPFFTDRAESVALRGLLKDRHGTIWLATENGLAKFDPHMQGFRYTALRQSDTPVYENEIYDLKSLPGTDKIMAVSRGGFLYFFDKKNGEVTSMAIAPNQNLEPTHLYTDSRNNWWLTTRHEVFRLDPFSRKLSPLPAPPRREGRLGLIWVVAEDGAQRLWFGQSFDGIFIYDPANKSSHYLTCEANGFCAFNVRDIQMDIENSKVWVATDGEGFWQGDLSTLQFQPLNQQNCPGLPSDKIFSLEQDHTGMLWLGTEDGLCRFDWRLPLDSAFTCLTVQDGLPANLLEGLQTDEQDYLWAGTSGKLVRIHPSTLKLKVFDHRYGVDFTPFPISTISLGAQGELYAGGKYGFLRWQPALLLQNEVAPKVVLTGVDVLGKNFQTPVAPEHLQTLLLNYRQNSVSFHFAALNFTLPDQNSYAWMLEGLSDSWIEGGNQHTAVFTQIPPGEYLFRVKAANNDGIWTADELMLKLIIQPAFWQTAWFKITITAVLTAMLFGLYQWRIRMVREQESLKAAFQKRIAEVEMTALRAQMNPHFVFNCLNSINRFIQMSDPDTASAYLTKFSRLIRMVLDNSREELVSLENEMQALKLYIELEEMRFAGRFQYSIDMDKNLDLDSIEIPPLLLQPYVENAIWHGLMHRKGDDGLLKIEIEKSNDERSLLVSIEDNGIGRATAAALKSKTATHRKSHGMALTGERIEIVRQLYGREVSVRVIDLLDKNEKGTGTRVELNVGL